MPLENNLAGRCKIALFGGHASSSPLQESLLWAKTHNSELAHVVLPPSDAHGPGFQSVVKDSSDFCVFADGMEVPEKKAVAIASGDCPIVVAYNPDNHKLAIAHAGRAALTPTSCKACRFNVIAPLLQKVAERGTDPSRVLIYVTAGICGHCFQHEQPEAQGLLTPFQEKYPRAIVGKYGLDLFEVIRASCLERGVKAKNITHDGLCTKEHEQLASHRCGDKRRNLTVVLLCQDDNGTPS